LERHIANEPSGVVDVNPVDIDVWLDLPGGSISAKRFTNKELIQGVANNIAQHVDRNIHPYVILLRSSRVSVDGQGGELMAAYFLHVCRVVARLAELLLSEAPAQENPSA
jgi:hypothetical protein